MHVVFAADGRPQCGKALARSMLPRRIAAWWSSTASRHATALIASLGVLPACGSLPFFQELQSEPNGSESSSSGEGSESTESLACRFDQEICLDQDRLEQCDTESEALIQRDCQAECGSLSNFSCVQTAAGPGCWCFEAGLDKRLSCSELETCLRDCAAEGDASCVDRCFSSTDRSTTRLYGALVSCVHIQCQSTCFDAPQLCTTCIEQGIADGTGNCALQRSVCDTDRTDDPFPYD